LGNIVPRLISLRPLTKKEIALARELGIRRLYLPNLTEAESDKFFEGFDRFWGQLVKHFGANHAFWRNVTSSKMQEWERSATYLGLVLFTLRQKEGEVPQSIVIVCASLEEEDVCQDWAEKMGWEVHRKPGLLIPRMVRRLLQEVVNLKSFLHMLSAFLYRKWFSKSSIPEGLLPEKGVLIASLFYRTSFSDGKYIDPFFGNLHSILKESGHSVTYLCAPLDDIKESVKRVTECKEIAIFIPYSILTWTELILSALRVLLRRLRLLKTEFLGCDFSRLLMWNARRFEYSFNLDSEFFYAAVKKLTQSNQFSALIQLYEGNVFERACIQAFRKSGQGQVVGYSHAVVFSLNLKIRMTESEKDVKPEPDFLVTSGPETKRLIVRYGNREGADIVAACSLRHIPVNDRVKKEKTDRANILIALDGVNGCATVLDWLMENAEIFRGYDVVLRAHPNVPLKRLLGQCLNELPNHFRRSDDDLETDLERCFCVVYRQTSVGLQALMNGVPVIHLAIDAPLPCDPIINLKSFKWEVSTPEELVGALQEIALLDEKKMGKSIDVAKEYVNDYFALPNERNLQAFMSGYHYQ
jgi:hypothetical protein